jgi:hypothetical protein
MELHEKRCFATKSCSRKQNRERFRPFGMEFREFASFFGPRTVTRRKVKFPYIHMMTPDDNGPRRENISRMRAG